MPNPADSEVIQIRCGRTPLVKNEAAMKDVPPLLGHHVNDSLRNENQRRCSSLTRIRHATPKTMKIVTTNSHTGNS